MVYNWDVNPPSFTDSNVKNLSKKADSDLKLPILTIVFFEVQGTSCRENSQG